MYGWINQIIATSKTTTSMIFQEKKPCTVETGSDELEPIFRERKEVSTEGDTDDVVEEAEEAEDNEDSLSRIWLNVDIL